MTRRTTVLFVSLTAFVLTLAACSAGDPPASDAMSVNVRVVSQAGNPVIGAAFAFIDTSAPRTSAIDMGEGSYLTSLVQVDAQGRASVVLPAGSSLPEGALAPAAEAIPDSVQGSACSATADPPSARISVMSFEGIIVPSIVGLTSDGLNNAESIVVLDESDTSPKHGWVYADRDVTITLSGDGCGAGEPVAFEAGWNQIAVDYDEVADTATLRRSTATNLVVVVLDGR